MCVETNDQHQDVHTVEIYGEQYAIAVARPVQRVSAPRMMQSREYPHGRVEQTPPTPIRTPADESFQLFLTGERVSSK